MKLALCIQTPEVEPTLPVALFSGSFSEKLAKAARLGYAGVELMVVDPTRLDPREIQIELSSLGLEAAAVASGGLAFAAGLTLLSPDPTIATQAFERLRALIDFAHQVGAPVVTIGSFRGRAAGLNQATGDPQAGRRKLVQVLQVGGEIAAKSGIRLALEALNRYEADLLATAEEGLGFLKEVNQPAVGLLLDTYHANIEEASLSEPFSRALAAGKLFHVHLGDSNRLPPGQGHIDFLAILTALQAGGYSGYLSAELLPRPDPDTAARQVSEHMHRLFGQL